MRTSVAAVITALLTTFGVAAAPPVVCQIITPVNGIIPAPQLQSIVQRAAGAIVDDGSFRRVGVSDALDACRTNENIDRCVRGVLIANQAALPPNMLILTARVTAGGFIDGTATFVPPDGRFVAVSYKLEPLDAQQRPRRHVGEQRGQAAWFAPDSTYLLQTAACDVAHRLGFAAAEKHVTIRAFDRQNGFADGTIDWGGSAIIR